MTSSGASAASDTSRYLRVAHRGAPAEAPENTLASFRAALRYPIQGIELDVRMSRDHHPIVLHDADLARTAGRPEKAGELDREELLTIDVGSWFGPEHAGERIPDLWDALDAIGDVRALVEVKDGPDLDPTAVARLGAAVEKRAPSNLVTLVSFHAEVLVEMRRQVPFLRTGLLVRDDDLDDPVDAAAACGASILLVPHRSVDDDLVGFCARGGYPVFTWTVDEVSEMERVLECGVVGIVSNRPDRLALVEG